MEVDEKPTEDYSDIGGLDKQIQELVEAIVLPVTHKVSSYPQRCRTSPVELARLIDRSDVTQMLLLDDATVGRRSMVILRT